MRTEPKPGVDPAPQQFPATSGRPASAQPTLAAEDDPRAWGDGAADAARGDSNDARLRDDIPPHSAGLR
ncbi:hypothetical protein FM112_16790 [Gulosibacter sp. 10]|nr:hypothetical protein FM112_16790 [Gulosibacter sp. 10]